MSNSELIRCACEARGLPVSLEALLQHERNNGAATAGFDYLTAVTLLSYWEAFGRNDNRERLEPGDLNRRIRETREFIDRMERR